MLDFINSNGALWSFFVTIATVFYVILTYRLLRESAKARKQQNKPYVIVDLEIKSIFLKMVVKNLGNSSALNVKIKAEPSFNNPFENIEFLAPNKEISTIINYVTHDSLDTKNSKYKFSVIYSDPYGENYNHEYNIDISPYLNALNTKEDNKEIIDLLGKIKDNLHSISGSLEKQVNTMKEIKTKLK